MGSTLKFLILLTVGYFVAMAYRFRRADIAGWFAAQPWSATPAEHEGVQEVKKA
jgi:hypothetical protein